ncbi:MAG: NAD(P)/FAD-dependent oxidoreductase [Pseudomonadota bacterium]
MGPERFETIIIGTGFSGLGLASRMKKAGRTDFVLLEKAEALGGTWRFNTYPGAECDVASVLYSYSFAPDTRWSHKWAKQPQILDYIVRFARDQQLEPHIRYKAHVVRAEWLEGEWLVTLESGDQLRARFLVSAIGQLHHPSVPEFEGLDRYAGPAFHTAEWDHSVDLAGRDVACIGTAASAVQLIPEVAKTARKLTVYHRSPNWLIDKPDRAYNRFEKWLARVFPPFAKYYRLMIWCMGEYVLLPTNRGNRLTAAILKFQHNRKLKKAFPDDPQMRERLTPDYPIGARRILLTDNYADALARDNVELVFDPVERFTTDGIVAGGRERRHDAVAFATGFVTNPFLKEIDVIGEGGLSLRERWAEGAEAYLGVITSGFPNLFMLYGPNTNTGHTSIIFKLEQQFKLVMKLIGAAGPGEVRVKPDAEAAFNAEMQSRLRDMMWAKIDESWYKDGERITNNWPGGSVEFRPF